MRNGTEYIRRLIDAAIENITGFTEDDTVVLTALNGSLERALAGEIGNIAIYGIECAEGTSMIEDNREDQNKGELK